MKDKEHQIIKIKKWIADFVIGLNLCPFARIPYQKDLIRYTVTDFESIEAFILIFYREVQHLIQSKKTYISTTLIIVPDGLSDFMHYLDVFETCQDVLDRSTLAQHIQIASFHPDYQFDQCAIDDVRNYTNRSPYPMIHVLRSDELAEAIHSHGHTEDIPIHNQELLKKMGRKAILDLLESGE